MPPKAKGKQSVGRALIRRHQGYGPRGTGALPKPDHGAAVGPGGQARAQLSSILEMNSLDDFLETALMAQRDFAAIKERDLLIIDAKGGTGGSMALLTPQQRQQQQAQAQRKRGGPTSLSFRQLKVPRRPAWHPGMTAAELDRVEKDAFLEWRREIAGLEEASGDRARVTPFEKNLEVWRQLWRVLERSHVVVQIVDARDPLFYYSEDLHGYACEMVPPRRRLILVNKADYLTGAQRRAWAAHFAARGWEYAFFSARREQERLTEAARLERLRELALEEEDELQEDEEEEEGEEGDGPEHDTEPEAGSSSSEEGGQQRQEQEQEPEQGDEAADESEEDEDEDDEDGAAGVGGMTTRVLTRAELLELLKDKAEAARADFIAAAGAGKGGEAERQQNQHATIGMVGFPNVGKSSVINVLMGVTALDHQKARVAVSSTPGKTKHFQTLPLDGARMLCDCPGLVFPSFVATTAEMVCAGVLPINQLRDHMAPVDLVCRRVPTRVLRGYYGLPTTTTTPGGAAGGEKAGDSEAELQELPPQTAREFLSDLCNARGYMAQGSGVPDVNRAARMVLKEYVEGRLVYCHPPPGLAAEDGEAFLDETKGNLARLSARLSRALDLQQQQEQEQREQREAAAVAAAVSLDSDGDSTGTGGASRSGKVRVRPTKKWGKKGKKLRDKNPYDDEEGGKTATAGARVMGRKALAGGSGLGFTRVTMPHYASLQQQQQQQPR